MKNFLITQLQQRVENLEKVDFDERFTNIEKQLNACIYACKHISIAFKDGIKVSIDEQSLDPAEALKECMLVLKTEVLRIREIRKEMQEELKSETTLGTLKFLAKTLHELQQEVHAIKEKGVKKDLHLALTLDGYEMVQKQPKKRDIDIPEELNARERLEILLDSLSDKQRKVLIHRFGLLGETKKTLVQTGNIIGKSREQVRAIQLQALRMCRFPVRKNLVENITQLELRKAILGE